jgi:hypothetical protein
VTEYERTGCATVVLEVPEPEEIKRKRVMLKLLAACITAEDWLSSQTRPYPADTIQLLRDAIAEGEKYCEPESETLAERIVSKNFS